MEKTIQKPRADISPYAPKVMMVKVPQEKIGEVIGEEEKIFKNLSQQVAGKLLLI